MEGYSKYYRQELFHLRELAKEFSEVHPAIAPMLSGQASDPDVERLLEGTAFLSGMLRQKIDDHIPELFHSLTRYIFPQFLRPIPSTTIVNFTPRKGLQEPIVIEGGTELGATSEQNVSAIFRTSFDCLVQPLKITQITNSGSASQGQQISVNFESTGPDFKSWFPDEIPFFLGGTFTRAAEIFYLLTRKLKKVIVETVDGKNRLELPPSVIQPMAFERGNSLLPYPGNAFSGYRYLQEYFLLPHKFLYLKVKGMGSWSKKGGGKNFVLRFEIEPDAIELPGMNPDSFLLSTVPAVNLFNHEADPIQQDHMSAKVRVTPAQKDGERPEIYAVDEVIGYTRGAMEKREYTPSSLFSTGRTKNQFSLLHSVSPINNRHQLFLQFSYPNDETELVQETLSVKLTCTNGDIVQTLKPGDICKPTSSTPELVDFSNLIRPTLPIASPLSSDLLWKLLSSLSLNLLSIATVESLVELLDLYIFKHDRDKARVSSNEKRLQGIENFEVSHVNKLVRGHMLRGQKIRLTARSDFFAGIGDFFLFGMVLDVFFSEYCSMNTFTQLDMIDSISGETYPWPTRIGGKSLI